MLLWIALTIVIGFALAFVTAYIYVVTTSIGSIFSRNDDFLRSVLYSRIMGGIGFALVVIVAIISKYFWRKFNTQCDTCKRMGALKFANTKALREEAISICVEMKQKNARGEVIGTQEQYIPGKRIEYQDAYRCKYCGAIEYYIRTADEKNI